MRHTRHIFFSALLLSLFSMQLCHAQTIDVDPRHPDWIDFPRTAIWHNDSLRRGEIVSATIYGAWGIGDIDKSGTDDFVVRISLTKQDSSGVKSTNYGLSLYRGVLNGLPTINDYERISPTEFASSTEFFASGDWDGDGFIDLCVDIGLSGDTSNVNVTGVDTRRVVIFWNDGSGHYSLNDTTRLPNPEGLGNDVWTSTTYGHSYDFSGDGIDDLLLRAGGALVNGQRYGTAQMQLYHGVRGGRWGRNGVSAKPVWGWWKVPEHDRVSVLDQNCDGRADFAFYYDGPRPTWTDLTMIYGNASTDPLGVPDTLDMERFSFTDLCGEQTFALLEDLTSDLIPDLVLTCHDWLWRIYAGQPGRRLSEVFGSGNDAADPENGFPDARPWAKIEMAGLLRGGFGSPYEGPLFALGDADLDGWNDLWTTFYAPEDGPNVVVYRSGPGFDMIIDGHAYFAGDYYSVGLLGDIDGTGNPTRFISNGYAGKEEIIQFFKSSKDLPTHAYDYPRKPPSGHKTFEPTGNRCDGSVGAVSSGEFHVASLNAQVIPNPVRGEVRVVWEAERQASAQIVIHDVSGRTIYRASLAAESNEFLWNAAGLPAGVYYVTITIGGQQQTVSAVHLSAGCC